MQINWKCGKHKYLFFILMLGCILRIVPISWGVPISPYIQNYHPDEPKVYSTILNFPEVYLNFNQSPVYGTCVQYVIGLLLFLPKLVISKLLHDGGLYFIMMLLASRLFSIMMGTATIYLTYQLAGKVFDAKTALLSAAFIAVSFYHVLNSSVITLDIAMSMLMVINFLLCFKAFEDNSQASYIKLGIATGFLLGTKITGGLFFAVPFLLSMMNIIKMKSDSGARRNLFLKQANLLLVYVFTAGAVFAMFHPHVFMDFSKYLNFYSIQKVNWMDRSRDSVFHTVLKCFTQTAICVGAPVLLLGLFGFFIPSKNNAHYKGMLIFYIFLFYALWRWYLPPRFIISIAPLICIFASCLCVRLMEMKRKILNILGIVFAFLSLGYSVYCCAQGIYLRIKETRPQAAFYLDGLQTGLTLSIPGVSEQFTWRNHPWRYPNINFAKFKEANFWEEPDIIVLSSYDFKPVLKLLKSGEVQDDYILGENEKKNWYMYSPPSPRILKLYDELMIKGQKKYELLQSFRVDVNVPVEFPPPEILIYKKINTE